MEFNEYNNPEKDIENLRKETQDSGEEIYDEPLPKRKAEEINKDMDALKLLGDVGIDVSALQKQYEEELKSLENPNSNQASETQSAAEKQETEVETKEQEIARLTQEITEKKNEINELRSRMGIPTSEEDPPNMYANRERIKKLGG